MQRSSLAVRLRTVWGWARDPRSFRRALAALGIAALLLRLINVFYLQDALGDKQVLDAAFYHDEARYLIGLLREPLESGSVRFANPGYSYALALIYQIVGASPALALAVQALLGGLSTVLLGLTAQLLVRERCAALFAAALWAFYLPSIYYDGVLLVPSLNGFLAILALFAVARASQPGSGLPARPRPSRQALVWGFVSGICIGVASLLRATNGLLALSFSGVLLALSRGPKARPQLRRVSGVLILGFALVVTPRILSQYAATGTWVPISANGGMNLWVGNNANSAGIYYPAPFVSAQGLGTHGYTVINERDAYLAEARRRTQNPELTVADADRFWRAQAKQEIFANLSGWLKLEAKKLLWFWNDYESRTNVSLSFLSEFSPVLRYNVLGFGGLALAGSYGLLLMVRRGQTRSYAVLTAVLAAPLAACLLFFVSGEYRFPASPALAIAAGFALSRATLGWPWVRGPGRGDWVHGLGFAAIAAMVLYPVEKQNFIDDFKAYAEKMVTPDRDGSAPSRENYQRSEALLQHMGQSYAEQLTKQEVLLLVHSNRAIQFSDVEAAQKLVQTAKQLWQLSPHPDEQMSEYAVNRIYFNLRRRIAQLSTQPFLQAHPATQRQLALLGAHDYAEISAYLQSGLRKEAYEFVTQALKVAPSCVELLAERGRLDLLFGRADAALGWLEKSYNGWPKRALPAALLSEYFLKAGNLAQAKLFWEQARAREPGAPEVRALREALLRASPGLLN